MPRAPQGGIFVVNDKEGKTRTAQVVGGDGSAVVSFAGSDGKQRAVLGMGADQAGALVLFDKDGNEVFHKPKD